MPNCQRLYKVLLTCITQRTGSTALRPIRMMEQLLLSVLLKDTSAATDQAGIRTHILTTPGPNFIALLTGKQIFVLTIAEKFA